MLVHPVMQFTLDGAAVGIRGHDEALSGFAQLRDLGPQSIELLLHFDLPTVQFDRPPGHDCDSCPSSEYGVK